MIRFDGYYLSDPQAHLRYDGGRRIEEEYFFLYHFFPDGTWICKTAEDASFDMEGFLFSLDLESIRQNPHENEPMTPGSELVYQSGTYTIADGWISIEWQNSKVQKEPLRWKFRITGEDLLETAFGEFSLSFVKFV